jgi:lysophospholipase L1-like esterase
LEAATGATTERAIDRLSGLGDVRFDVLVTSLGVNDITRGARTGAWLESQRRLRTVARERLGVSLLVISGIPPMDGFPALPNPLRRYLGNRARRWNTLLEQDLEGESSAHFLDPRFTEDAGGMAVDGFHPGPAIYREWGARAAAVIAGEWPPPEESGRRVA